MVRGIYLNGLTDDLTDCLRIRSCERDAADDIAVHVLLFDEEKNPVTTARIQYGDNGIFLVDEFYTLEASRNHAYGEFVMYMVLDKARQCHAVCLKCSITKGDADTEKFLLKFGFNTQDHVNFYLDVPTFYKNKTCGSCNHN